MASAPEPFVALHPLLADVHDIAEGDLVAVTTGRGTAYVRARVTADQRPDTLFMPFHWGGLGSANRLTNDRTDPVSGMPDFKVCAASITRVPAAVPELEVIA